MNKVKLRFLGRVLAGEDAPGGAILGSLIGATVVGIPWGLLELRALMVEGVAWAEGISSAAAVILLVALACMVPGAVVGWMWRDRRLGGTFRAYFEEDGWAAASRVVSLFLALFGLGWATFFALAIFAGAFASLQVRAIAVGGVAPFLALGAYGVYRASEALLGRITSTMRWSRQNITRLMAGVGLATLGWAWSFLLLAPEVADALEPARFIPFVASLAGAVLGGMLLRGRTLLMTAPVVAVVAAPALGFLVSETSPQLNQAIEQETRTTRMVLGFTRELRTTSEPAGQQKIEGAASCLPGVEPPAAEAIGEVGADAPNIMLVTVDALRWDRTSMSGYKRDTTPHLAEYADEAATFESAYTPATSTRQSFRGLFSGAYPSLVAAPQSTPWGLSFADDQETLAGYLSAAGYRTIAVVSDPGAFPEKHGALAGFEVIDDSAHNFHEEHNYSVPYKVDRLISHLSDPTDDRPVFIWTHIREAHQPFLRGPDPVNYGKSRSDRYDAALNFLDGELDRLMSFSTSPHHRQDTYLFLSADHGEAFNEHGHRAHGSTTHQEQSRVPLMVWGPDVEPARHPQPITLLDVMPTLFDVAGLESQSTLCGESLAAAIRSGEPPPSRPIYVEQLPDSTRDYFSVAFIRGKDSLIIDPSTGVIELYDMEADPAQEKNLAEDRPEKVEAYLEELRALYDQHGIDPSPYKLDQF